MNIFILDTDPIIAAQSQCDKHVVKMIVESAQMLSTAHRMLDGELEQRLSTSGKTKVKYYKLPDDREDVLYKAVHFNHPCSVWVRESKDNYLWLFEHFEELLLEYTFRYGKVHKTSFLLDYLFCHPDNIARQGLTPFVKAMGASPESGNISDPVEAYRHFYQTKQANFDMVWTGRPVPHWFKLPEEK